MADPWADFRVRPSGAEASVGAPDPTSPAPIDDPWSKFRADPKALPKDIQRVVIDTAPKRPDNGMGDALVQGVKQGVTAGFSDELQGIHEAGGGGKMAKTFLGEEPDDNLWHTLSGFAKFLAQDPEAHAKYNETVTRERERIKAAGEHHPIVKGVGEMGGTMATLPLGGAWGHGAAATAKALAAAKAGAPEAAALARSAFGARALGAAEQGAVYGGLTGAGEGEGATDTAIKAAGGTALGGVVGGVAAPVLEGAGQIIKRGTEKFRNAWRAATDADAEASRQGAVAYIHDRAHDPNFSSRMHPDEFRSSPEARNIDLGGNATRRLADVAGIMSPGGEQKLKDAIGDRFKGQTNRFTDWFRSHFNYADAYGQKQALDEVAKTVNGPNYAKAYQEGSKGVWSKELERLSGAPSIQEALFGAVKPLKDRGIVAGYKLPRQNPFVPNPQNPGTIMLRTNEQGNTIMPELAYWDQAVRNLGGRIGELQRAGNDTRARDLVMLKQRLLKELDARVPSYKAARQGAAGFFGADNALEAGVKFVSDSKMGLTEARAVLAKMTPGERRLFQDGFVDEYVRAVINKTGDNRDVLLKIANNPEARGKLELVMGRERMQMLEAKIRVEQIFNQVRTAIQGNSFTTRRLVDLGLMGGQGVGALTGFDGAKNLDPKEVAIGAIVGLMSRKGSAINANVASKVVDMMLSRDPAVWEKGFKLISSNPKWLDALRDADTKIGRALSSTAPTSSALQLTGAVRADDQQPGVQRPVGR